MKLPQGAKEENQKSSPEKKKTAHRNTKKNLTKKYVEDLSSEKKGKIQKGEERDTP